MTKNTQTILSVLVLGVVGYVVYKKFIAKPKVIKVEGTMEKETSSFTGDEQFFNLAGQKMVVGGYNSQTNQTWVFPEGNMGGGYYVKGKVNAPIGSTYTSNR